LIPISSDWSASCQSNPPQHLRTRPPKPEHSAMNQNINRWW